MKNDILIFGYDEYAKEIARNFAHDNFNVYISVLDSDSLKNAIEDGFKAEEVELDDDWLNIQENFDIDKITCFCALENDAQNVFLTISLRSQYPHVEIISLATSKDSATKLRLAGANKSLAKLEVTANVIVESLERPAVIEVMNEVLYTNADLKLAEFNISKDSFLIDKDFHDINLQKEYNIIILAITDKEYKKEFTYASHGLNHKLSIEDILVVMGRDKDLKFFEKVV